MARLYRYRLSGSTTDLASVVEMFDNLLERSRRGAADSEPAGHLRAESPELARLRRVWRLQPGETTPEGSRGDRLRKSASSGSGDSGLSSPLTFVASPTSPGAPDLCDPSLTYIERVVAEVVDTEAVYVNDLRSVIEGYLFYWRENPEPAIVDEYTDALFSNVQEIFRCNSAFLAALELCQLDPTKVATSFVNHGGRFAVYIDYCTKYPRTVSVLTELMRRETTARLFRERQAALGHALPLGSFLLETGAADTQNMKSHTDSHSDGYGVVCAALDTMTALAGHINDMKRRHEHAVRVQEIQSLLYGWEGEDLTTYGELVAEGAFRMHRAKASRHVFLFDRMVLITKRREDATLAYKAHIMCSNLMLIESIPGDPYSFHVVPFDNPRLQYTLQARSMEQKRDWALQLKRAILESYNAVIPFHARELVMQLGQDKAGGDQVRRNSSSKRQHSAPEYLERRRAYKRASFNQKLRLRSRDRKSSLDSRKDSVAEEEEDRERKRSTASCPDEKRGRRSLLTLRRKSEPFISLLSPQRAGPGVSVVDSPSSDLQVLPDLDEEGPADHRSDCDDVSSALDDATDADDVSECDVKDLLDGKPDNLQSIVEQLVMQNMEFRRILNKPRRGLRRQNSAAKSEETDSDGEVDDDDLSFSACAEEEDAPPAEPSALAFHSHGNTEYVSFFDYTPESAAAAMAPAAPDADTDRAGLHRTVSDPCRRVVRKIGRFQGVGQSELLHFLGSIRKKSARLSRTDERPLPPPAEEEPLAVRRAQSFNDQDELRPAALSLATLRRAASSVSDPVPARASTYLTPQLAKKADSLPGTFQRTGSLGRTPSVDFDADRYLAPRAVQEDDRLTTYTTTPGASSESLNVHPDYRIYGPAVSQSSLRSMVGSFRARLMRLKQPSQGSIGGGSSGGASLSSLFGSPAGSQVDMRDQSRNRLLYIMAKSLKERVASLVPDEAESDAESPRVLPTGAPFAQGGAGLGARLARGIRENASGGAASPPTQPKSPRPAAGRRTEPAASARAKAAEARPDSMLSSSSVVTSSSVSSGSTSGVATETSGKASEEATSLTASDGEGSVGSFYEHELDILEDIHGSELFRDSAIYSDPDELLDSIEATLPPAPATLADHDLDASDLADEAEFIDSFAPAEVPDSGDALELVDQTAVPAKKVPPPVPAKPNRGGGSIKDRLRSLEESQLRREDVCAPPTAEALKSISERRRELEQWRSGGRGGDESETSSQHSTCTVNTVIEAGGSESRGHSRSSSREEALPRGWVKQVIGKLQGETTA
ncbi:Pleckstrin y domain-containing family G member 1 [Amphibalanus amphitrite]|uniref:Pleckstrin y domain-containing family G member 1 n=1 Tax=Amphibalanus amphitrite TaxID=1232801 RepID=A0A6A4V437_AMPAM|nr:Pleckstrin y domain-containing family G member 1 [Amphibalanus amphitrite]